MRRYRKARRRTPLEMSKDGYIPEAKLHSLVIPNWEEVKNLFQIIPRKKIPPKLKLLQLPHICVKEFFQYEPLFVSVVSSGNQSFVSRCMGDVILRLAPPRIALEVVISGRRWRMDGTVSEFGRIAICDRDLRFDPIECPYCFERFSSPAERKLHRKLHKLPNNTQLKYDAELRLRFERIGSNFHWYREDACCPQVAPCTWTGSPALWTPADDDECILFGEVRRTSILSLRLRPVYNTQSQAAFLSSLFPHFVLVDNTLYSSDEDEEQYSNQYSLPTHTVTTSSTEDDSENGDFEKVSDHSSFQNEIPRTTIGVPCLKRQRVLTRPSTSTLPSSHHIITPTSVTL